MVLYFHLIFFYLFLKKLINILYYKKLILFCNAIIFKLFIVGVIINYKLLSLLFIVLIFSISSVSAEYLNDENSLSLMDNDGISEFSGAIDYLEVGTTDTSAISDNPIGVDGDTDGDGTGDTGGDGTGDTGGDGTGDTGGDDNGDAGDGTGDEGNDDPEIIAKNTTLTILSPNNWKLYGEKNYTVQLLDEDSNPVKDAQINFKIKTPNGKYITKTDVTDEKGMAVLPLNLTIRGIHNIEVSYGGDLDYNPAQSVNSNVTFYIKTVIKSAKYSYRSSNFTITLATNKGTVLANKKLVIYINNVKYTRTTDSKGRAFIKMPSDKKLVKFNCTFFTSDYYAESKRILDLPVYKKTYTKPLVYAILKGKYFKIQLKGIDGKILKNEKVKFTINGKNFTRTTNKKGIAYLKVNFKRNEYKVCFSYGNNSIYGPSSNSSVLNVIDPSGQYKRGLNQVTKLSVSKYLYGGGYARVTKYIKKLSKKITGKYSTKLEKATAIFNYVRNTLDYEYYANSRKGASKTLKTKAGNCCDHANLIVALCRASKIPARYSHAQGCRFKKSGRLEGHVWAQIYVGGRWYSADGTSYKNSLGHVNNWDTKSYYRFHSYRNIPF